MALVAISKIQWPALRSRTCSGVSVTTAWIVLAEASPGTATIGSSGGLVGSLKLARTTGPVRFL